MYASGNPLAEQIKINSVTFTYRPSYLLPVVGSFEPAPFNFRYYTDKPNENTLPADYYYSSQPVHLRITPNTNVSPSKSIVFDSSITGLLSVGNIQCCGQLIDFRQFYLNSASTGGIITLNQTVNNINTVAAYNPKVGYLEVRVSLQFVNTTF